MAYKPGDYLVTCDQCGFQRYASDCRMTWNNLFVCADTCWEEKHPQYVDPKPLGEKQSVPVHRPEPLEVFINPASPITQDDL
jgi:hypothetical protein